MAYRAVNILDHDFQFVKSRGETATVGDFQTASANDKLIHGGDRVRIVRINGATVAHHPGSRLLVGNGAAGKGKKGKDDGGELHDE